MTVHELLVRYFMKFHAIIVFTVFSVVVLMSCGGENPKTTFVKMRQDACNSNPEGFFKYLDKQAVRDKFERATIDKFTQGSSEDKLSERSQAMPRNLKNEYVTEHMNTLWSKYENWIDLGKDGPLCKMEIINSEGSIITINIPGEPNEVWGFNKSDSKWKVVFIK